MPSMSGLTTGSLLKLKFVLLPPSVLVSLSTSIVGPPAVAHSKRTFFNATAAIAAFAKVYAVAATLGRLSVLNAPSPTASPRLM